MTENPNRIKNKYARRAFMIIFSPAILFAYLDIEINICFWRFKKIWAEGWSE